MTSINTNKSALLALGALNAANAKLSAAQQRVSTGLAVAGAKDNASTFAIAQGMRAELSGQQALSQGLARGQSALEVALSGAESINDLLSELKAHAIALNDPSSVQSRDVIRADMEAIIKQIDQVARSAEFDGLNLLTGRPTILTTSRTSYSLSSTMAQPAAFSRLPSALPTSAAVSTSVAQGPPYITTSPEFATAMSQISGAASQTVLADAGAVAGRVNLFLDAYNAVDVVEIWQNGVRVAATGQSYVANGAAVGPGSAVSGQHVLSFDYDPAAGQNLEFRFNENVNASGSVWRVGGINLQDPADPIPTPSVNATVITTIDASAEMGAAPGAVNPEDAARESEEAPAGAVATHTIDAGAQAGRIDMVFDAFDLPDTVEVYQAGVRIAASGQAYVPGGGGVPPGGPVSGQTMLSFDYDPALGDVTLQFNSGGADINSAWAVGGMVLRASGSPIAAPAANTSSVQGPGFSLIHYDFLTDTSGQSTLRASSRDMTSGGLGLAGLDWSNSSSVLTAIQEALDKAVRDSAYFGTTATAFDLAFNHIGSLSDVTQTGIGNLVDADLDREAAKLTAAQIQQQLALQSLSIANAAPRWLQQLFARGEG